MKSVLAIAVGVGFGGVAIGCTHAPQVVTAKPIVVNDASSNEAPQGIDRGSNVVGTAIAGACESLRGDGKAVSLYAKACSVGDSNGCMKGGAHYVCGIGVVQNSALGVSMLGRACELDDTEACIAVALIFIEGRVVPRDTARAYKSLEGACNLGKSRACGALGGVLLAMAPATEHERAAALLEKACEADDHDSCRNFGIILEKGIAGRSVDYPRAFAVTKKACEAGNKGACGNLGVYYVTGRGTEKDEALGVKLLGVGCDGGDMGTCVTLAKCLQVGVAGHTDPTRAEAVLKVACDRGNGQACRLLADASIQAPAPIPANATFF